MCFKLILLVFSMNYRVISYVQRYFLLDSGIRLGSTIDDMVCNVEVDLSPERNERKDLRRQAFDKLSSILFP